MVTKRMSDDELQHAIKSLFQLKKEKEETVPFSVEDVLEGYRELQLLRSANREYQKIFLKSDEFPGSERDFWVRMVEALRHLAGTLAVCLTGSVAADPRLKMELLERARKEFGEKG